MVLWLIPSKMEDECSSLESFHRRDPRMNGTERPSVGEGISYDTYYKFFNILLTSPTIFQNLLMILPIIISFPTYHYIHHHMKHLIPYN